MGLFSYTKEFIVNTAMPARRTPFSSGPQNWTRRLFEGVSDAFTALSSTDSGKGASQVGIQDALGNFTSTDVEGALAELAAGGGGGGGGGVTSVTASSPLASSGGATPDISLTGTVSVSLGGTGITAAGAAGNVLTSDGTDWASTAPANVNVGNTYLAVGDGTGIVGSSDLSYNSGALTLEVTNTVSVTNGANALSLQSGSVSTDAATLTVDAASTVQLGGTGAVSIAGAYTLPSSDGTSGQVLTTDGLGAISWGTSSGLGPANKIHYVVEGGSYATIQAAIDAAADWDVILVGPKAAGDSWGPAVFSPGKRLVVASLLSKWSTQVRVDSITFNANSGLNTNENTVFVRGLFINSSFTALAPGVNFYGSAPARLRLQECFIYNNNSVTGTAVISNNSGAGSSLYLDNTVVQSGYSTGIGVDHQQGYTNIRGDSEISRYQYPLQCAAGFVEVLNTMLDGSGIANEVVRISGGTVTCGYSTIKNSTTNSSGVNLTTAGAVFGMGDATFAIATGTGYCVNGVASTVFLYGSITYSHSVLVSYNVKVKNTISAVAVTQVFTSSP